jgi:hypothetical protein
MYSSRAAARNVLVTRSVSSMCILLIADHEEKLFVTQDI